ncbi:hypothetical protein CRM22_000616 [Opisthorchis felineus]|uniref:Apple domain-containing protein n=1 Tax=Opisthorchis felineus TaxID=147828 RepID=A0A4S2ML17_OPIFE|nr:hypothetical protein CRM22_000616 [Opisthorchis felineus]
MLCLFLIHTTVLIAFSARAQKCVDCPLCGELKKDCERVYWTFTTGIPPNAQSTSLGSTLSSGIPECRNSCLATRNCRAVTLTAESAAPDTSSAVLYVFWPRSSYPTQS